MKVEKGAVGMDFKLVTLTITFETQDELLDMYVRHILNNDEISALVLEDRFGKSNRVMRKMGKPALAAAVNSTSTAAQDVPLLVALEKEILK